MKKLFNLYLNANLILFPLFFLPIVPGPFTFGKNWFLFVTACVGLFIWAIGLILNKKVKIYLGRHIGLFLVFLIWVFISWLRQSPSVKTTSLSDPGGLGTFISLFIWYFLWLQSDQKQTWFKKLSLLTISGIIISIISLVIFILPDSRLPIVWPAQNPLITIDASWSFAGLISADIGLFLFLVFEVGRLVFIKSTHQDKGFILNIFKLSIICLGLILSIYKAVKLGWGGLDYPTGWLITADAFKNSPIWGVGISNFLQAFNLFRPFSYNLSPFWEQRFITSSSGFFHYWTELGIGYLILLTVFLSKLLKYRKNSSFLPLIIISLVNFILPPNIVILWLMAFVFSHKFGEIKPSAAKLVFGEEKLNIFPYLNAIFVLSFISFGLFISTKKLLARVSLRDSMVSASKNDGMAVYNQQIKAISYDPTWAELRKVYSQTNISLAQSLSSRQDISDQDREQISILLQQAVREAKNAVTLAGPSAVYWSNLGNIYRSLIGTVEGAPDWALEAFQQASVLDNADPLIRMEIGSLYYAAAQYENADRLFEEVLLRKPNYANGWYNWAHTAKNLKKLADAITRLSQAVLLVPIDSADYEKANGELTAWRQEFDRLNESKDTGSPQSETLKTAEPLPTISQPNLIDISTEDLQPPLNGEPATKPSATPSTDLPQSD